MNALFLAVSIAWNYHPIVLEPYDAPEGRTVTVVGYSAVDLTLEGSTDLVHWYKIETHNSGGDGYYKFIVTPKGQEFYRAYWIDDNPDE
jgi:hypothetical protein